jgi:hypothetical protein
VTDDDITRLRTLAQADAAARHRAMQWHADQRLTDQDDDEVHHTTEALRARLDGFVILELLDRQQRAAPSAEPVITDAMVEAAHGFVRSELRGVSLPDEYMRGLLRAALEGKR